MLARTLSICCLLLFGSVPAFARSLHVVTTVQELWYPLSTAELIAKQTGARLVRIPGMTEIGGSYIDHIDQIVHLIAGGVS
jgi:hypothetical protein